jgi:hypothetical protein
MLAQITQDVVAENHAAAFPVALPVSGRIHALGEPSVPSSFLPSCCGQSRGSIRQRRFAVLIGRFKGSC